MCANKNVELGYDKICTMHENKLDFYFHMLHALARISLTSRDYVKHAEKFKLRK